MYTYKAKLDRVVDGDTVDAYIDLGFDISVHKRIRLAGIDSPESRTRDLEEKARGLASKDRLIDLLKDGKFILESKEVGKYGRVLGTLFVEKTNDDNLEANEQEYKININETLVQEGYATEYWEVKRKNNEQAYNCIIYNNNDFNIWSIFSVWPKDNYYTCYYR